MWIEKRLRSVAIRGELADEWKQRGVQEGREYSICESRKIRGYAVTSVTIRCTAIVSVLIARPDHGLLLPSISLRLAPSVVAGRCYPTERIYDLCFSRLVR